MPGVGELLRQARVDPTPTHTPIRDRRPAHAIRISRISYWQSAVLCILPSCLDNYLQWLVPRSTGLCRAGGGREWGEAGPYLPRRWPLPDTGLEGEAGVRGWYRRAWGAVPTCGVAEHEERCRHVE